MIDGRQITNNLGGRWRNGRGQASCPVCQPERRRHQTALSISGSQGKILLHCFKRGCSFAEIANAISLPLEQAQVDIVARRETKSVRKCLAILADHDCLAELVDAPERAALAFAALISLSPDEARLTAQSALSSGAGQPIAPLFNHMDEAAFWADMAEPDELKAYTLAAFNRMSHPDQVAFLSYVQPKVAA